MIIDDRPNRLQYLTITPGYEDGNGDYHQGESKWEGDIPCRNVPAGKAEQRQFEDGVVRTYSSVVRQGVFHWRKSEAVSSWGYCQRM